MQEIKKNFFLSMLESIAFMLVGIFALFFKTKTTQVISYSFGAVFAVLGLLALIKYFFRKEESKYSKYGLVYGLAFLVIASIFIFKTESVISTLLPYMIGIYIVIASLLKFDNIFILKNNNNTNWKVVLILSVFSFLSGLLLIFNPFEKSLDGSIMIGICVIIYAILNVVNICIIKFNNTQDNTRNIVVKEKEE